MRLVALFAADFAAWASLAAADDSMLDSNAIIGTDRLASCLRRPHDDPHHCIGLAAKACFDNPSDAPNAIRAAERCDLAEANF